MSAASRALRKLADHHQRQAVEFARSWPGPYRPIYDAVDYHQQAAEMARATAAEERWRERVPRFVRRRVLRRSVW